MEILKHGQKRADRTHTVTCRDCDTEFRFQGSEGTRYFDQSNGNVGVKIECPVCGRMAWVND